MVGFSPHEGKQREFLQSHADWVFYGGARGGGKSLMLSWKAALTPRRWTYHYLRKEISKTEYKKLKKEGKKIEIKVQKIS